MTNDNDDDQQDDEKLNSKSLSSIDKALIKFLTAVNLPFSLAESQEFKRFCKLLNPIYSIPSSEY